MFKVKVTLDKPIIPDKMFFDGRKFIITEVDQEFIIKEYYLYFDDDKRVQKLFLPHKHPNCDPETNLFCLPELLRRYLFLKR